MSSTPSASVGPKRWLVLAIAALAMLAWPRPSHAAPPSAGGGQRLEVQALWSDGDELLLVGGRNAVAVYSREGEQELIEDVEISRFIDAAGTRAGDTMAVFAAADGRLAIWGPGGLRDEQVPLLEGDELVAVAVDAGGTIYAVGRELALYELDRRWRIYPFPTQMRPLAAAASPGGQVYIVGRDGLLIRFVDGEWDRPLVPGLKPASIRAPWYDAWYSAVTETLWVRVGRDYLIELEFGEQAQIVVEQPETPAVAEPSEPEPSDDEASDEAEEQPYTRPPKFRVSGAVPAREHPIPTGPPVEGEQPSGFTALAGASSAAGDRIVTSAGDRLWLWDHERFVLIAEDLDLVRDLALDEGQDTAWLATQSGLSSVALVDIAETRDEAPPDEAEQKVLARIRRQDTLRQRQAEAPRFFWMPTIRIDNGVAFHLGAEDPIAGYSLELAAGAMLQPLHRERGPSLWVWPELAYRFEEHPTRGGHLFDIGVGVGFGGHLVNAFYRPRLVLGGIDRPTNDGPAVYGIRNGLAVEALWGIVGLEFSHQVLGSNEGALNDLRLGLSINLAPLIWAGILWATIPTGK